MPNGGFVVRFEDKEEIHCASTCPPKLGHDITNNKSVGG